MVLVVFTGFKIMITKFNIPYMKHIVRYAIFLKGLI
jgi:hypothetical protein